MAPSRPHASGTVRRARAGPLRRANLRRGRAGGAKHSPRSAVRKAPVGAFYTAWRYRSATSVRRVSSVTRARRGFEVVVIGGRVPLPVDPRPAGPSGDPLPGSAGRCAPPRSAVDVGGHPPITGGWLGIADGPSARQPGRTAPEGRSVIDHPKRGWRQGRSESVGGEGEGRRVVEASPSRGPGNWGLVL